MAHAACRRAVLLADPYFKGCEYVVLSFILIAIRCLLGEYRSPGWLSHKVKLKPVRRRPPDIAGQWEAAEQGCAHVTVRDVSKLREVECPVAIESHLARLEDTSAQSRVLEFDAELQWPQSFNPAFDDLPQPRLEDSPKFRLRGVYFRRERRDAVMNAVLVTSSRDPVASQNGRASAASGV